MKKYTIMLVFACAAVTLLTVTPLAAQTLNAESIKKMQVGKIWAEKGLANLFSETFWEWKADGSVCVRLFEKRSSCDYVGSWKLQADRLCYKLDKWGGRASDASRCIRISEQTTGRYDYTALDDNSVQVFTFTVLD